MSRISDRGYSESDNSVYDLFIVRLVPLTQSEGIGFLFVIFEEIVVSSAVLSMGFCLKKFI